jgi:hypothetical protein
MNPFDFVNSINSTKKNLIRECEDGSVTEKDYTSFLINKALSYFPDTLLYANEINMQPHLDGLMQYDYYLNSIRKGKRFSKWSKPEVEEELKSIAKYFSVSMKRAQEYQAILTNEQKEEIRKHLAG